MKHFQIRNSAHAAVLYEGNYASFRHCLEAAIQKRIPLPGADLRRKNLSNANLDDAILPGAQFTHSNLSGINLSESYLKDACFTGAVLYNACLKDSNLTACDFTYAAFGATDIDGAILAQARFSSLSCFSLNFSRARGMSGCIFIAADGRACPMSRPPLVVQGLGVEPLILMDDTLQRGHNRLHTERLERMARRLASLDWRRRLAIRG